MVIPTGEVIYLIKCSSNSDKELGDQINLRQLVHSIDIVSGAGTTPENAVSAKEFMESLLDWAIKNNVVMLDTTEMVKYLSERYGVIYKIQSTATGRTPNPALLQYGECLTDQARMGKLDPVIDRCDEIDRGFEILSRRTKNNPVFVGAAGIGKSAIARGMAIRIAEGSAPQQLLGREIFQIHIARILEGTIYRGQFEERLNQVIEIAMRSGHIIFIDEIHNLSGAGSVSQGTNDAANILKPFLADGSVSVIGTTTHEEYRKFIESDSALDRRFQKVIVNEPSIASTIEILTGSKALYETHHNVDISDEVIGIVAKLADRHIHDRNAPDGALDLMDESSVHARNREAISIVPPRDDGQWEDMVLSGNFAGATAGRDDTLYTTSHMRAKVTESDVINVLSRWTGHKVLTDDFGRVTDLEPDLKSKIVNQDDAIEVTCSVIRSSYIYGSEDMPLGTILALGPPGVGKTYMAECLADELFDGRILRLDMATYNDRYTISALTGSPPGYIGSDRGGILTNWAWENPYSLVLFDEIEKAHPDVYNVLLSIMDAGKLNDMYGRTSHFSNILVIITSNIGTRYVTDSKKFEIGFGKKKVDTKKGIQLEVKDKFSPEFLDRLSGKLIFNTLTMNDMYKIIDLEVAIILEESDGPRFTISDSAKEVLLSNWKEGEGARHIRRELTKHILEPLANRVLARKLDRDGNTMAYARSGKIMFRERS